MKNNPKATSQAAAADPAASHDHAARWVAATLFAIWAAISVVSAMAE